MRHKKETIVRIEKIAFPPSLIDTYTPSYKHSHTYSHTQLTHTTNTHTHPYKHTHIHSQTHKQTALTNPVTIIQKKQIPTNEMEP